MVYNGTSCGLNEIFYAPHFGLPTVKETLWALLPGFYQCDLDVQDHFLNLNLHKLLWEYSGVDVHEVQSRAGGEKTWEASRTGRWEHWEKNGWVFGIRHVEASNGKYG